MNKKELVYAIALAASLFSLSLLLFSQGTTSLSVSLNKEQPLAVAIPTMYTMNKVIIMVVLASIGTHSLTMLTTSIGSVQKTTTPGIAEIPIKNHHPTYSEEDSTSKIDGSNKATNEIEIFENSELDIEKVISLPLIKTEQLPFNKAEHKRKVASDILEGDEKKIYLIVYEKKEILQSELVLESGLSKVKVSRLLQKLESKSLLIKKPYGNTNKVMLAE